MRPLFLTLILMFLFEQVSAQEIITKNHLISIKENMNVKIELEGEISLKNLDLPKACLLCGRSLYGKNNR